MNFTTQQLEKYADVLIWGLNTARRKPFKPYDTILVRFDLAALPLAEIIHKKLIKQKRNVLFRLLSTPTVEKNFYGFSDSIQRKFINAGEKELYSALNGNIYLSAPASLTHLKEIDPKKINETMISRKPFREIMDKREEQGAFGWTLCTLTTKALAEKAKMTEKEYTAQVCKACFLNEKDPVKKWQQIFKDSQEIKKWLNALPIKTIRVQSKKMDLQITLGEKRKFIGVSGHNIPSFEIFVSPDWRGTEGVYFANQPSYRSGNYVENVRLVFKKGRAIEITAGQGQEFVRKTLATDHAACQIGEFSLTDKRFSKIDRFMADTLFDENFGGTYGNCHIAVGSSYSDTYAGNPKNLTKTIKKQLGFNDSALHWDLVNTEDKTVTARLKNGQSLVIYEKGIFKY
jgi:aminopeptidase